MNRIDRLVAILLLLQSRRIIRAQDIAGHFNISIRTVYRDMNALGEAGVPLCAEAGEGYSIIEGYHLPPVMFTREEASALFMGGKFVERQTDASVTAHAQSALLKIQSVLPEDTQDFIGSLQNSTAMLIPAASGSAANVELTALQDAIVNRRIIAIDYFAQYRASTTRREVEPIGLLFYSDHWHLIAYCLLRQGLRDFRTDRIKHFKVLDRQFRKRPDVSLKSYLRDFGREEAASEIVVRFDNDVAHIVRERQGYGLLEEKPVEDGVVMTFLVPDSPWTHSWLFSYGPKATVLSPDSLRQLLAKRAKEIFELYQD